MSALVAALEATPLPALVNAGLAYPVINTLHLLGVVLFLGSIGLVDLRLLGLFPSLPRDALVRALTPPALAGLLLLGLTGPLLFLADAGTLLGNPAFRVKLGVISIALLNAILFRRLWQPGRAPGALPRGLALLSLVLWLVVAGLGRWIAYV